MTITAEDLSAFIDGELPPPRQAEIAAALAADPALAARAAAFRRDRLAQGFGPQERAKPQAAWLAPRDVPASPHAAPPPAAGSAKILPFRPKPKTASWPGRRGAFRPARLLGALTGGGRTLGARKLAAVTRPALSSRALAIAACLILLLGLGLFWRAPLQDDTLVQQAQAARAGRIPALATLHNPALSPAGTGDSLLRQATSLPVHAPDLHRLGWQLAGIATFRGAAELRYSNAAGEPLTIYLRRSPGEPRLDLLQNGKSRVFIWQDDVTSAVFIADMPAGPMMRLVRAAMAAIDGTLKP